jgi:hypothetical protein
MIKLGLAAHEYKNPITKLLHESAIFIYKSFSRGIDVFGVVLAKNHEKPIRKSTIFVF